MPEDAFTKIQTVELHTREDVELWRWIEKQKEKWRRVSKVRRAEVRLDIDSGGIVKFKYYGELPE